MAITGRDEAQPPRISPYLDWAAELRTQRDKISGVRREAAYRPYFLELDPDRLAEAAAALLDLARDRSRLLIEENAARVLDLHRRGPERRKDAEAWQTSLTIYQREGAAVLEGAPLWRVLHIGEAVEGPTKEALAAMPVDDARASRDIPLRAVIDDGIGFLNRRFTFREGATLRSRFAGLWLQSFDPVTPPKVPYFAMGLGLGPQDIDHLLGEDDEASVYARLNASLAPSAARQTTAFGFSHGTHVADLFAGEDPQSAPPFRDMLGVQLPPAAVEDTSGLRLELPIVEAVIWVLTRAIEIGGTGPVVINLSFGVLAGRKDGMGFVETVLRGLLDGWSAATGRETRLVLAFGNWGEGRQAARLGDGAIDIRLQPDGFAASFVEIRSPGPELTLTLLRPDGSAAWAGAAPAPGLGEPLLDRQNARIGTITHVDEPDVYGHGHVLVLAFSPTASDLPFDAGGDIALAPAGRWRLILGGTTEPLRIEVQRGDTVPGYRLRGRQAYLEHPAAHAWNPVRHSWTGYGPGSPIGPAGTQTAYASHGLGRVHAAGAVSWQKRHAARYASAGSADTTPRVVLSAIADDAPALPGVLAAGTYTGSVRALSGSSAAAPRLARGLAGIALGAPGPSDAGSVLGRAPGAFDAQTGFGTIDDGRPIDALRRW